MTSACCCPIPCYHVDVDDTCSRYALGMNEEEPLVANARHRAQLEAAQGFLSAFLATGDRFISFLFKNGIAC